MPLILRTISDSAAAQRDLEKLKKSVENVQISTKSTTDSFANMAKSIGTVLAAGYAINSLTKLSDEFTTLSNKIKAVVDSQKEFNIAMAGVKDIALNTRNSLGEIATLYGKIALNSKDLGINQTDTLKVTQAVAQALKISGATQAEKGAALLQFGQSVASGRFSGDELRTLRESAPYMAKVMAEIFKVPLGDLKKLGEQGKLLAGPVLEGFVKRSAELNAKARALGVTYEEAFTNIKTGWKLLLNAMKEEFFGTKNPIAEWIDKIGVKLGDVAKNFHHTFLIAKADISLFIIDVLDIFEVLWETIKEVAGAIGEVVVDLFKDWEPEIQASVAALIGFTKKAVESVVNIYEKVIGIFSSSNFFKSITDNVTIAITSIKRIVSGLFDRIQLKFPSIDLGKFFPNLSTVIEFVQKWATKIKEIFMNLYDKLVGHSIIPDLLTKIIAWFKQLLGAPVDHVNTFAHLTQRAFLGIGAGLSLPFILGMASIIKYKKELVLLGGILGGIAGVIHIGGKDKSKGFLENLESFWTELKPKLVSLKELPMHTIRQGMGLPDPIPGTIGGTEIDNKAKVGRGKDRYQEERPLFHDILNMFPKNWQVPILTTLTATIGLAIIAAFQAGTVRNVLLIALGSVFTVVFTRTSENAGKTLFGHLNSFLGMMATGLRTLFGGSIMKDPFGFLTLIPKLMILFAAGRQALLTAATSVITAPTHAAEYMSSALDRRRMKATVATMEQTAGTLRGTLQRNFDAIAIQYDATLQRIATKTQRTFGEVKAAAMAGDINAFGRQNRSDLLQANTQFRQYTDASDIRGQQQAFAKSLTEQRRLLAESQSNAAKAQAAFQAGFKNFFASIGGVFGGVLGFQVGDKIAQGMSNSPEWLKLAVRLGASVVGQMTLALAGAGFASVLLRITTSAWTGAINFAKPLFQTVMVAAAAAMGPIWTAILALAIAHPFIAVIAGMTIALLTAYGFWRALPDVWKKGLRDIFASDESKAREIYEKDLASGTDPKRAKADYEARILEIQRERSLAPVRYVINSLTPQTTLDSEKQRDKDRTAGMHPDQAEKNHQKRLRDIAAQNEAMQKADILNIIESFKGALTGLTKWIWSLLPGANTPGKLAIDVSPIPPRIGPNPQKQATGGLIDGPGTETSDSIPAMLSKNEFVVNAKSTKKYRNLLETINRGNVPGFQKGGLVQAPGMIEPGNLDLENRKILKNKDNTFSTIESKSFNIDGVERLLPTINKSGKRMSDTETIKEYKLTGEHLGAFKDPISATKYAKQLSARQGEYYKKFARGGYVDKRLSEYSPKEGLKLYYQEIEDLKKLTGVESIEFLNERDQESPAFSGELKRILAWKPKNTIDIDYAVLLHEFGHAANFKDFSNYTKDQVENVNQFKEVIELASKHGISKQKILDVIVNKRAEKDYNDNFLKEEFLASKWALDNTKYKLPDMASFHATAYRTYLTRAGLKSDKIAYQFDSIETLHDALDFADDGKLNHSLGLFFKKLPFEEVEKTFGNVVAKYVFRTGLWKEHLGNGVDNKESPAKIFGYGALGLTAMNKDKIDFAKRGKLPSGEQLNVGDEIVEAIHILNELTPTKKGNKQKSLPSDTINDAIKKHREASKAAEDAMRKATKTNNFIEALKEIKIGKHATGGFIQGPGTETSDSIPAMLSKNEFVVNAKSAKKYSQLLHAINENKLPGFFEGTDDVSQLTPRRPRQGINYDSLKTPIQGPPINVNVVNALNISGWDTFIAQIKSGFVNSKGDFEIQPMKIFSAVSEGVKSLLGLTGVKKPEEADTKDDSAFRGPPDERLPLVEIIKSSKNFQDAIPKIAEGFKERGFKELDIKAFSEKLSNLEFPDLVRLVTSLDRITNFERVLQDPSDSIMARGNKWIANENLPELRRNFDEQLTKAGIGERPSGFKKGPTEEDKNPTLVGDMFGIIDKMIPSIKLTAEEFEKLPDITRNTLFRSVYKQFKEKEVIEKEPIKGDDTEGKNYVAERLKAINESLERSAEKAITLLKPTRTTEKQFEVFFENFGSSMQKDGINSLNKAQINFIRSQQETLKKQLSIRDDPKSTPEMVSASTNYIVSVMEQFNIMTQGALAESLNKYKATMDTARSLGINLDPYIYDNLDSINRQIIDSNIKALLALQRIGAVELDPIIKENIQKLIRHSVTIIQDGLSKIDMSDKIGMDFAQKVSSGFSTSVSNYLKGYAKEGETPFRTLINSWLDMLTQSIIDAFVQGLTASLSDIVGNSFKDFGKGIAELVIGEPKIPDIQRTNPEIPQLLGEEGGYGVSPEALPIPISEDAAEGVSGSVTGLFKSAKNAFDTIWKDIDTGGIGKIVTNIGSGILNGLMKLGSMIASMFSGNAIGNMGAAFTIPGAAEGGLISGPGGPKSDSIPAMLSAGEYVINAESTKRFYTVLDAINNGRIPHFAEGGPVSRIDSIKSSNDKKQNQQVFNIQITGDINRQTRSTIYEMLPQIASGVNSHNREKGYKG